MLGVHPIERLRGAGVAVSVNTDDPALLGTSFVDEYALCSRTLDWSDEALRQVAQTSSDARFEDNDGIRKRLRRSLAR